MRLGIDLMGSDQPPQAIFEAALQVSKEVGFAHPLVIFVQRNFYNDIKKQYLSFLETVTSKEKVDVEIVQVSETIEMHDSPLLALRRKKDSSIAKGIRFLQEKKIDAFLSTGNTGALVATARYLLPLLPGIEMPALCVMLPKEKGFITVLDVGANIAFQPHHLIDYAKLGFAYQSIVRGIANPKIGLLNIGTEEKKGTKLMKEGFAALQDFSKRSNIEFLGNVEGREVFQGDVDVLVTDGFTGNVFLKTCEGVSSFLMDYLKKYAGGERSETMNSILIDLHERFNYSKYPGAQLLGCDGIVIKCHGYSNAAALMSGIRGAFALAKENLIKKMKAKINDL
jgi:glycerol-3-phosphate acyltransferase PlsX